MVVKISDELERDGQMMKGKIASHIRALYIALLKWKFAVRQDGASLFVGGPNVGLSTIDLSKDKDEHEK